MSLAVGGKRRFDGSWSARDKWLTLFRLVPWFIRGLWKRLFFANASGITLIGPNVKIYYARKLRVGANFVAERGCEINCLAERGLVFGNRVSVGSYAVIRPANIYGGDIGEGLKVGDESNIGPYSYIGCSGFIEIGNRVMISPRVSIYAENHVFADTSIPMKEQGVKRGFVKIEDDCWIASNSVILSGVTVGKGSVVAAGSVVTKDVPPYAVVGGNPAKVIKMRKDRTVVKTS